MKEDRDGTEMQIDRRSYWENKSSPSVWFDGFINGYFFSTWNAYNCVMSDADEGSIDVLEVVLV